MVTIAKASQASWRLSCLYHDSSSILATGGSNKDPWKKIVITPSPTVGCTLSHRTVLPGPLILDSELADYCGLPSEDLAMVPSGRHHHIYSELSFLPLARCSWAKLDPSTPFAMSISSSHLVLQIGQDPRSKHSSSSHQAPGHGTMCLRPSRPPITWAIFLTPQYKTVFLCPSQSLLLVPVLCICFSSHHFLSYYTIIFCLLSISFWLGCKHCKQESWFCWMHIPST